MARGLWIVMGILLALVGSGCSDDSVSTPAIVNDTNRPVTLRYCMDDDCGKPSFPMSIVNDQLLLR